MAGVRADGDAGRRLTGGDADGGVGRMGSRELAMRVIVASGLEVFSGGGELALGHVAQLR